MAKKNERQGGLALSGTRPTAGAPEKPTARVVELRADNFARLKAAVLRPTPGGLTEITGRNGQGKTSLLNAIRAAVKGKGGLPPGAKVVRVGAEKAELVADLGSVVVHRVIKPGRDGAEDWTLKVVGADTGRPLSSPQAVLDAFKAEVGFDPLDFLRMKPAEQADVLKRLVPDFDFADNASIRAAAFAERTDVNRRAKQAAAAAALVVVPAGPRPEAVDVSGKLDELQAGMNANADRAREHTRRGMERDRADGMLDKAERLRAEAASLEKAAKDLDARLDALPPLPEEVDVAAVRALLGKAEAVKAALDAHQRREEFLMEAKELERESEVLTEQIDQCDNDRANAVAAARLPVPGLSFADDAVLLNGLPLSGAGGAEQIEACVAIAMALNPGFRVVLIDEGSELDSDARALVARMAVERGYDVILTRVDESGTVGVVIEDGEVVERSIRNEART